MAEPTHLTRPLHYPLRTKDQIVFLHIPKTGGTTFMEILRDCVGAKNFLSTSREELLTLDPEYVGKFRVVRGHFSYSIAHYFNRHPIFITLLREPVARVVSNYRHLERNEKLATQPTLRDFVLDHELNRGVNNKQLFRVTGIPQRAKEYSLATLLDLAKARLDDFPFVGLLERFDDSIKLLSYTFGWNIQHYQTLNQAPSTSRKVELDSETQALIEELNREDILLYQYAQNLFEERLELMQAGK